MEKMVERKREPEPVQFDRNIEDQQLRMARDMEKVASLPRVLKAVNTPWTMGIMAFERVWVTNKPHERLAFAPICTMGVREQILEPGIKGGRHRHVNEAIFYMIEGEGYEIHDGKRYEWSAGDIVTVPCYSDHQHQNSSLKQKARMWFSGPVPITEFMAVNWIEQIEMRTGYSIPPDCKPIYGPDKQIIGYVTKDGQEFKMGFDQTIQKRINSRLENIIHIENPRDTYQEYIKQLEDEVRLSPLPLEVQV